MIVENRRGLFERINLVGPSSIEVPEILDHTIQQPKGVSIQLKGPRENLEVFFQSSIVDYLSIKQLFPFLKLRFCVTTSPYHGFSHGYKDGEDIITIPSRKDYQEGETIISFIHEIGHAVSLQDDQWNKRLTEAKEVLKSELFFRPASPVMLSYEPEKREKERSAMAIILQEERRASVLPVQTIKDLRHQGIDLVPHLETNKEISSTLDRILERQTAWNFYVEIIRKKNLLGKRRSHSGVYIEPWSEVTRKNLIKNIGESFVWMSGMSGGTILAGEIVTYLLNKSLAPEFFSLAGFSGIVYGLFMYLTGGTWRPIK